MRETDSPGPFVETIPATVKLLLVVGNADSGPLVVTQQQASVTSTVYVPLEIVAVTPAVIVCPTQLVADGLQLIADKATEALEPQLVWGGVP